MQVHAGRGRGGVRAEGYGWQGAGREGPTHTLWWFAMAARHPRISNDGPSSAFLAGMPHSVSTVDAIFSSVALGYALA